MLHAVGQESNVAGHQRPDTKKLAHHAVVFVDITLSRGVPLVASIERV
ncbi:MULTISPECIES: hypothetical protein [Pseudosulfitobacter]|nr:hypothetical protein [Pseudosulfitobacter pseudonitzschiae]QKS10189.1 hypothetical protein HT745_17680 [Pseudosulfitobacter pseudonitzschiae]